MELLKNIVFAMKEISKASKVIFIMMGLCVLCSSVQQVLGLVLIKYLIEYALSEGFVFSNLMLWLLGYAALTLMIKLFLHIFIQLYIHWLEMKLKSYTNSRMYEKIIGLDLANYDDAVFYDQLHRALDESDARCFVLSTQLMGFFSDAIAYIGVFTFCHDPVILLAVACNVLNYLIYYFRETKKQYDFNKKEEPYRRLGDYLDMVFYRREYAEELRSFPAGKERLLEKFSGEADGYLGRVKDYVKRTLKRSVFMSSTSQLIFCVMSVYVSAKLQRAKFSVGDFLVMLNVTATMSEQLINLFKGLPDIIQSGRYIRDIREILDAVGSFREQGGQTCAEFESLEFKEVCFSYGKAGVTGQQPDDTGMPHFAIRRMNFTVQKHEVVAVVGINGSGKSTMMDLLLGLLKPDLGEILLNGTVYGEYNISSVRKLFGVVFQNFQLYEISVAENILMREVESEEDTALVWEALLYVGLSKRIGATEKGIHTVVGRGDGTDDFSLGERQRIAIARAYASKAQVLVFDEPTSSLDVYATKAFYKAVFGLRQQGRTVMLITHKLQYAARADKILFVQGGAVAEQGSHEELLRLGGGYAALYYMEKEGEGMPT